MLKEEVSRTHPDVEYHLKYAVRETFQAACFDAVLACLANGEPAQIDVCIWSEEGARFYAGDDGVERYQEDPEASVFERIVIKAESLGRVA